MNHDTNESSGKSLRERSREIATSVADKGGKAIVLVGDLNGDGKVDAEDARIVRERVVEVVADAADEAGRLAKSVARAPLTRDVATYAAIGAVIALPLPIVGPAIGAALGAGLGLWRNSKRLDPLPAPDDPIAELERLQALIEKGAITEQEFITLKRRLLGLQ